MTISIAFLKRSEEVVLGAHELGVYKAHILVWKYHEHNRTISAHPTSFLLSPNLEDK